jgi:hypothetical protein
VRGDLVILAVDLGLGGRVERRGIVTGPDELLAKAIRGGQLERRRVVCRIEVFGEGRCPCLTDGPRSERNDEETAGDVSPTRKRSLSIASVGVFHKQTVSFPCQNRIDFYSRQGTVYAHN